MSALTATAQPGAGGGNAGTRTLTVIYATESGNAQAVAGATLRAASGAGCDATIHDMSAVNPHDIAAQAETLLVVAATAGEGEAPAGATAFFEAIMAEDAPSFAGTSFAVLALGDRAYADFCGHGAKLDARLEELGGRRFEELVRCDFDYESEASAWISRIVTRLAGEGTEREPVPIETPGVETTATISDHRLLHGSAAERQSAHLALTFASPVEYEPGDLIDITPRNDPAVVADLLAAAGIDDAEFAEELRTGHDVTTLTAEALATLDRGSAPIDPSRSRLVDAIRRAPRRFTPDELRALLRPIAPRSYSIASSPLATPGSAEVLIAELNWREPRDPDGVRSGVTSGHLVTRSTVGDEFPVRVKPSPNFHLPTDSTVDIVMIGAGSGVAPFRGFVQHRRVTGARGRAWLFFGHRRSECDFLYEEEWRRWLIDGSLTRLDTAFSRDQTDKVYVQHAVAREGADLAEWVRGGAVVYICGDRAMGRDVEQALDRVLAPRGLDVAALARDGRLRVDTY
jgi:sulfite reductase (NADPH) flavoprotein alpha-component